MTASIDESTDDQLELTEDVIFSLLASQRRRDLLRYVAHAGAEVPISMITEHVTGNETDGGVPSTKSQLKAVYVSLYQTHIPQLVEAGVVEYDPDTKVVRLTQRAEPLLAYLSFDPTATDRGLLAKVFRRRRDHEVE
ncbi:hypothetical protein VB773_03860 [Haloarculaceae archaeon H-GB2-1]|nr:hypothetical protein [Haloarculaceae archaeon H-GB1-1]MEA5388738.1 hypothetical protein [Haloarculaceae archaeon H-GB11]MEA5406795.1 hypothetical protein [Haloarculaceae archaeon H-GB2-1]